MNIEKKIEQIGGKLPLGCDGLALLFEFPSGERPRFFFRWTVRLELFETDRREKISDALFDLDQALSAPDPSAWKIGEVDLDGIVF